MKDAIKESIEHFTREIDDLEHEIKNANFGYGTVYSKIKKWCDERELAINNISILEAVAENHNLILTNGE